MADPLDVARLGSNGRVGPENQQRGWDILRKAPSPRHNEVKKIMLLQSGRIQMSKTERGMALLLKCLCTSLSPNSEPREQLPVLYSYQDQSLTSTKPIGL